MGKSRSARNNELPRRKPAPPMDEPKVVAATTQAMIGPTDTSVSGDAVFQTIIGNLADAVFVHDLDGDFLLVNPTACQNLGYSEEELLRMGVEDVDAECIERDDRQRYWLSLKPGQKVMQRVRHRRRDGSEYCADVHINRINLDGQPAILAVARDLTELLHAQELHRKTEEMLLQSQSIAHTGSFIRDLATNKVTWSDEQYRVFGYEPGEIVLDFEAVTNHVHPDDRERFLSTNRAMVEDNQEYDSEYRIVRKDGAVRWIRSRAIVERDDTGQPRRVVGAIQDITESVRVRTEREFDSELMRTMLDTSSEVMFLMEPEGIIVACNEVLERRLKLRTDQIIGRSAFELIDRDVADTRRQHVSRVLETRRGITFEDHRAGRVMRHTLQPVLDDDGEVKYIAVHGADLTGIRATETELEHKQLLLSQAELLSGSGAFEWDLVDGYFYASDGWKRIHGVSADKLTFEELMPLAHPDDRERVQAAVEATISGKAAYNIEHRIVRADNQKTRYVRANAIIQRDKHGKPVRILGSSQDITEKHFAHQHLAESEERYRTLIDTATDAIFVADPHTSIIIDANRQAEELLGRSREEIVGLHQTEIHPPEERKCAQSKFGQATQNQGERYTQMHVQHKDGRRIPVEISSGGVVKAGGTDIHFGIFRDISSRLEAERAERERRAELEQVFKAISDAVLYADTQRRIVFVNPAFTEVFGYTADEAVGQSTALIYNSKKEYAQAGRQRYNPERPADYSSYEIEYRKKNGETFLSETVGTPVFDSDGKLTGFLGIIRDITEKKAAENALKESQRFAQMIADTTPSLLYIYDVDENRNIWVNAATSVRFDWSDSETAEDVTAMVHPEDVKILIDRLKQLEPAPDGTWFEVEYRFRNPDGSWSWFSDRAAVFQRHEDGRLSKVIGSAIDINNAKNNEQRLRDQVQFLQRLMDTIPNPLYYQDNDGRVMGCNKAFEEFFGRTRNTLVGRSLADLSPRETVTDISHKDRELHARGGTQVFETKLINGDNQPRSVVFYRASFSSTEFESAGIIGVMVDITDRRRMERELFKAEKLDSIGVLAGGIAHDFNNILVAILGNISLARMEIDGHNDVVEMLQAAENATERAQHLTHQLLTFSKGGAPVRKAVNVASILKETAEFALHGSNARGEFHIEDSLKSSELDEGQFTQVINNLIINAIQAMPTGGTIQIRAENFRIGPITNLPLNAGEYIRIAISDQGIGISPENISRIFDPFFTTKDRGSGLGLASCYSIIKAHDGHIDVNSRLGIGSTFTIYLPACETATAIKEPVSNEVPTGSGRILVMDDEESLRRLTSTALTRLGYTPEVAADGLEAVAKYREAHTKREPFDLVILDLTVPGGMGGQSVLRELKRIDKHVRAIVASGYSSDPILANFRQRGFSGRLIKPFRIEDLANVVNDILTAAIPS